MRLITSMVLLTLVGLPLSAQSTHQKNAQAAVKTTEQKVEKTADKAVLKAEKAADKAQQKVEKTADKTEQKAAEKVADVKADAKKETAKVAEETAQAVKDTEIKKDAPAKKEEAPKAAQPEVKEPAKTQASAQPAKTAEVEKSAPAVKQNAAPTAAANQAPGQKKSELTVSRAAIALNINNLEPENAGDTFPPEVKRLYCFTHIKGSSGTSEIQHRWYWNDDLIGTINLPVKSPNYRTYSAKTIPAGMVGEWMVAIVDSKNEEILKMLKIYIK